MADYQARLGEFASLGAGVVGISVDDGVRSERVRRQFGLAFPLLGDPSRQTVQAWGLLDPEDSRGVAFPATVVVGRDGRLGMVRVEGTRRRLAVDAVLGFLRGNEPAAPALRFVLAGPGTWLRAIGNVARNGWTMPRK